MPTATSRNGSPTPTCAHWSSRTAARARHRVRRAHRGAQRSEQLLQQRVRVPSPAERSRRTRHSSGAALRDAAAGVRRPAAKPADGDAAGAPAGARPNGERRRTRHQQRDRTDCALHRFAARARTGPDRARSRLPEHHPARHRRRRRDRQGHARVLPSAGTAGDAHADRSESRRHAGDRDDARALARLAAAARHRDCDAHGAAAAAVGDPRTGERDPRRADQSDLQRRRRDAGRRHAHCAHARLGGDRAARSHDSGIGMDETTRRRCLEPFFTTKGERGTGLGLAMVYGMVRRHSAELEIDSTLHQGTTMRIVFPAAQVAAVAHRSPLHSTPRRARCPSSSSTTIRWCSNRCAPRCRATVTR